MVALVEHQVSLRSLNTFAVAATAEKYVRVRNSTDLNEVVAGPDKPSLVLGGGSNILFANDGIPGLVLHIDIKGIDVIREDKDTVTVKAMAGENWHDFVCWCLEHNYGGLENLSLIPGSVGAAPVQNIGAYGVELKDVLLEVHAVHISSGKSQVFTRDSCGLAYRDSIFKNAQRGEWVILSIIVKLTKHDHVMKLDYGAIRERLEQMQICVPTIVDVSRAVVSIRQERLPDPKSLPNAGSFFKNPVVSEEHYQSLKKRFPDIPGYRIDDDFMKVPAGWLIEQCGWKGRRHGRCAVHDIHALVIVNDQGAGGDEILALAQAIQTSVEEQFLLRLVFEVNILDFS